MNDLLGSDGRGREGFDLEAGSSGVAESSKEPGVDLSKFFHEVDDIKNSMAEIGKNLRRLEELQAESKSVTKASEMKELKGKMDQCVDDTSKIAHALRAKIEALDKANLGNRKQKGCEEGTGTDRTRMAITATLKKKLKGLMDAFQSLRHKFQDEYREVVERRYFTVTGHKPDEATIEHLIDTGDSEQIFQKAIQEQGRGRILDTVAEIQERHDVVKDIEKKLMELHQIFLDMSVLVEAQGELLDNIESQVSKAVDHVARGTLNLQKAKRSQKSSRRCMCFGIILLLIIIIIILVAVIKPWSK